MKDLAKISNLIMGICILISCTTTSKKFKNDEPVLTSYYDPLAIDCIKIVTPVGINYYLCEDPMAYCYLGEQGGISCFLKENGSEENDSELESY